MIYGHTDNISQFHNLIKRQELPPVLIFYGPKGIGKSLVAKMIASRLLLGSEGGTEQLEHPDFIAVDPLLVENEESAKVDSLENRAIDGSSIANIRDLVRQLKLVPFAGGNRFVLFDHAESIGVSSFQLLLKPLEESKSTNYFCFVTSALSKLPLTIRSRSQIYNFLCLDEANLRSFVSDTLAVSETKLPDQDLLELIIDFSMGSPALLMQTLLSKEIFIEARQGLSRLFAGDLSSISYLLDYLTKSPPKELHLRLTFILMLLRKALYKSVGTKRVPHIVNLYSRLIEAEQLLFGRHLPLEQIYYPIFLDTFMNLKAER
jgi:DNA polymerase III, delta subunit